MASQAEQLKTDTLRRIVDECLARRGGAERHKFTVRLGANRHIIGNLVEDGLVRIIGPSMVPTSAALELVDRQIKDELLEVADAFFARLQRHFRSTSEPAELSTIIEGLRSDLGSSVVDDFFLLAFHLVSEPTTGFVTQWSTAFNGPIGIGERILDHASFTAWHEMQGTRLIEKPAEVEPPHRAGSVKGHLQRPQAKKRIAKWEVGARLGGGGQGRIFLARHLETGQLGALKLLKAPGYRKAVERFARESAALATVHHLNVVNVLDQDLGTRTPYICMEYCEGGSLDKRASKYKGDIAACTGLLRAVIHALSAAHAAGVIHRDLKPANILFRADGTPVVADFGICLMDDNRDLTSANEAVGPRGFLAPELDVAGKHLGDVSPAADVYCLGKLFFWLWSGGEYFPREEYRLVPAPAGIDAEHWEHVCSVLDAVVQSDPTKRASLTEFDDLILRTEVLIRMNAAPLSISDKLRCRFCGIGMYHKKLSQPGRAVPELGLNPPGATVVGFLTCDHCGHVELFNPKAASNKTWWGSGGRNG